MLKKKIWSNFPRIIEVFTQKIVTKPSKYGFEIRDPGSRGQKGTGSRIRIRNTAFDSFEIEKKHFLRILISSDEVDLFQRIFKSKLLVTLSR
jgi:hypothetical protein